jgi:hypothetical protein
MTTTQQVRCVEHSQTQHRADQRAFSGFQPGRCGLPLPPPSPYDPPATTLNVIPAAAGIHLTGPHPSGKLYGYRPSPV